MGMLEKTDQILKWNIEDTGTASGTHKVKASSALLRHITWWWQTHTFKERRAPNNTHKLGPMFSIIIIMAGMAVVDYIITRREKLKNIKDRKVLPGECAIAQHRILVMDYTTSLRRMARARKRKPQIRWWKMKKQEENDACALAVLQKTLSVVDNLDWQDINQIIVETQKKCLGK